MSRRPRQYWYRREGSSALKAGRRGRVSSYGRRRLRDLVQGLRCFCAEGPRVGPVGSRAVGSLGAEKEVARLGKGWSRVSRRRRYDWSTQFERAHQAVKFSILEGLVCLVNTERVRCGTRAEPGSVVRVQ
jgi:hypothetical protein